MSLEEQFRQHELQDAERHGQILRELGGIGATLRAIDERIDRNSGEVEEITDSHLVAAKDDSKFWRTLFIGTISFIATTGLGALVTWLLMK